MIAIINMIIPEYISLQNWSASLLVDYRKYHIPILMHEDDWKQWAEDLLSVPPFRGKNIPLPSSIDQSAVLKTDQEWQPWARAFYLVVSTSDL